MREGGNAVDAAVGAVMTSFVTESPLTGLGAGGYMLVYDGSEVEVLDFFVAVPGADGAERGADLIAIPVYFTPESPQVFHIGAASCGVPGTPAGLEQALVRHGTIPLAELAAPAARLARDGVRLNEEHAFFLSILEPILTHYEEARAIYAPEGRILAAGEPFRFPELGDALERLGAEGSAPFYRGDVAAAISDWVTERGGTLGRGDLAAYEPIARRPVRATFAGREVLTNPPPSAGGILIAFALELLERTGATNTEGLVAAMETAQAARTEDFLVGLEREGFGERFLDPERLAAAAERAAGRRRSAAGPLTPGDESLGSTTHITVVDGDGRCASVTCSNGTGSGLIVPGTGVHVNNMLGEEDLNPHGFHRHAPGRRMPSMMSPTVVVRDGGVEAALGSGGSNRIRSAVLQTIVRLVAGDTVADAVVAPRVHFEAGVVQAEPGVDPDALESLERRGYGVVRWDERNVFFGGVHAVARDAQGAFAGGGDPRRGGAVAYA